jgi:hypothetical protein
MEIETIGSGTSKMIIASPISKTKIELKKKTLSSAISNVT